VTFGWQEEFLREERRMREKISSESEEWDMERSIPMKKRRGELHYCICCEVTIQGSTTPRYGR
jgi:hypothetical protein